MNTFDSLPLHVKRAVTVLNNFVGEGKRDVSGSYLNWKQFTDSEKQEIIQYLQSWQTLGYLSVIGDLEKWPIEKVCYSMNNFIGAIDPLPAGWFSENTAEQDAAANP